MAQSNKKVIEIKEPKPLQQDISANEIKETSIEAAISERFEKIEADAEKYKNLMLVGFFILLVMVATIIIMVLLDYKNSSDKLHRDQYEFLNLRMGRLENIATNSGVSK